MKIYAVIILVLLCSIQGMAKVSNKLIICGDRAFPPYEYINEEGKPDGFNVDLVRAIMDELNLSYDLQLKEWPEVLPLIESNQIDLITGIIRSEGDRSNLKFSKTHSYIDYTIVCRKDSPIRNPEKLENKNVIVQKYSLPYEKQNKLHYAHKLIVVDDMIEGLRLLSQGQGDAAICPDNMAKYVIFKDGLTNLNIINVHWPLREYCFASKDTYLLEQIDTALAKLKKNGAYARIYNKWIGSEPTFEIPVWIYFLIGTLLLTAILLTIFVRIFKQRIKNGKLLLQTENKKLNALLCENEDLLKRYLTVFNTTLVGIIYFNKDGIMVNINDEMIKLFQMDDKSKLQEKQMSVYQDSILRSYGIIDENNQIHEFHGVVKYDMRKGLCVEYFPQYEPKKDIFYLKIDVIPIKNNHGEMESLLITAVDQTAETNHKQQMEEEEIKLKLALEAGNIAAWYFDPQKQTFNTILGSSIAGKGMDMDKNLRMLHPDDHKAERRMLQDLLDGKLDTTDGLFRYKHEDGTYHVYESRMVTKKEEEKIVGILGTQKDVTNEVFHNKILNDTVKKLRFAIQTANIALWVYDCEALIFTSYNDPIADYKDGAPISMDTYDSYFQKDGSNWEQVENATRIMKNGEDKSYTISVKLQTKYDKECQYCTIRGVPFEKDNDGKVVKYLGVRVNMTDQVNYQKILEQEKTEAQQADKLKSIFLANMSHEIRTPLNAIVGFSELLQTTEDSESRTEFVNIINQNNELLLRLINDILDLSKIESGYIELKPEVFDLSEVFEETYLTLKQRCSNPEVDFWGKNPYKSCKVKLDRNRLVQIGTNFITNSIKHTNKGHILMGYEYKDEGVRIFVEDTGCGVSKEKQTKLFQRFAKLDDFTQGTGLGLAICKALTDAQNGKIGVNSEEGKGSTFWAWFPCKAEIEEYGAPESQPVPVASESTIEDKPKNSPANHIAHKSILVAEDIDSNYLLIKAILKEYNLTRAITGKEAVYLASIHHYDAILMDMKMPVMGGIEATQKIREFDKDILIIAVTANAFDSDRTEALSAGCNAFVTKPVKKKKLEELLKE